MNVTDRPSTTVVPVTTTTTTSTTSPVAPQPAPKPAVLVAPDELSTGEGFALRRAAVLKLGANLPQVQVAAAVSSESDVDLDAVYTANSLGYQLQKASPEERRELIKGIFENGQAAAVTTLFETGPGPDEFAQAYDLMGEVGTAFGEAYRAGDISDEQLKALAEELGPDQAERFVQTLALGLNTKEPGGVVEAFGEQAAALGLDRAAALAFTSSDLLIDAHYPDATSQRAAFEQVKSFIDDNDGYIQESYFPENRHGIESALVAAARLTSRGNGYSDEELDAQVEELGPELVQEAISLAGRLERNGLVPGPLDTLGDAATRAGDGFEVAAALAYSQSPQLISENLGTPEERERAFDALNGYLAGTRGAWADAQNENFPYALIDEAEAADGITQLLFGDEGQALLDAKLEAGAKGEADLVQLFESISMNGYANPLMRDRLTKAVEVYVQDQFAGAKPGTSTQAGERAGRILGALQVAANRAIAGARTEQERSAAKEGAVKTIANVSGVFVQAGLTSVTGPLGAALSGAITKSAIEIAFGPGVPPDQSGVEEALFDRLEEQGVEVSAGEAGHDAVSETFGAAYDALVAKLATARGPERRALETQRDVLQGLINGIGTYGDTLLSSEGGGELARELSSRS